jgi:hypothetical protein
MKLYGCSREAELTATLRRGAWPAAAEPDLRSHVELCRHCQETVLVTQALQASRRQAMETVPLQAPGLLWWRAQLRRRNQTMERATRPVALVELVSVFVTLAAAAGLAVWRWRDVGDWLRWVGGLSHSPLFRFDSLSGASPESGAVTLIAVACTAALVLFAALAVYLLTARE